MLCKRFLHISLAILATIFLIVAASPLFVSANNKTCMLENEVRREQLQSNGLALLLYVETKSDSSFPSSADRWAHDVLTWAKQHKRNDISKLLKCSSSYEINPKLAGRSLDDISKAERAETVLLSEKSYCSGYKWRFYMDDHVERVREQ